MRFIETTNLSKQRKKKRKGRGIDPPATPTHTHTSWVGARGLLSSREAFLERKCRGKQRDENTYLFEETILVLPNVFYYVIKN